jgi:hypothetical protein
MIEQEIVNFLKGVSWSDVRALWAIANPTRNRELRKAQGKRWRERKRAKEGWARRDCGLPF